MLVHITDTINHAQAVCHVMDVEPIGYEIAPEHMPVGYALTPEALELFA